MNTTTKTSTHALNYHLKATDATQPAHNAATRLNVSSSQRKTARNFDMTMSDITNTMSTRRRLFSKFIHVRAIEAVSDVIGSTFARPNALLFGASFSFVLTLGTYVLAKNLGYSLSGFESIGAFLLGWLIGLVYDFLKLMVTGKH